MYPVPVLKELYSIQFESFIRSSPPHRAQSAPDDLNWIAQNIAAVFNDANECYRWVNSLPEVVKSTIEIILVEGQQTIPDLESEIGVNLIRQKTVKKKNNEYILMPGFYLFQLIQGLNPNLKKPKENYALDLPLVIRNPLLKSGFKPASETSFISTQPVENLNHLNSRIDENLVKLLSILKDPLRRNRFGHIKKIIVKHEEIYPAVNPEQLNFEIHLLIHLFDASFQKTDKDREPLDLIRNLVSTLQRGDFGEDRFIPGIQHTQNPPVQDNRFHDYFKELTKYLTNYGSERWIDEAQLVKVLLRSIHLKPTKDLKSFKQFQKGEKIWIDQVNQKALIEKPLLKTIFGVLSLLGILYRNQNKELFLTSIGLDIFRLKKRGGPALSWREKIKIDLDSDRLLIELSAEDPVAQEFIETFAIKLSQHSYCGDISTLISNIKTEVDLDLWEEQFKFTLSAKLPANWKAFLKEAKNRIHPLELRDDFVIYQLSEEQKELAKLLTSDPKLKKIVCRVENYKIAVLKEDLPDLKSRLKQKGFLL